MKRLLFLTLVLAFVFAGTANAAVKQGDKEISIFGSYRIDNFDLIDGEMETILFGGSLGFFISDQLELSLIGNWNWMETTVAGVSAEVEGFDLGGNAKYHFMTDSTTVPYAGYQIAYSNYEAAAYGASAGLDGVMHGPLVGAKFFMNESTSLFIEYQYKLYDGDVGDLWDDGHAIVGGISFKF